MFFNSYIFILAFLPIALIGYFGLHKLKKHTLAKVFLCTMSLIFYAYYNIYYLGIIITSIILNYFGVKLLKKKQGSLRKIVMIILIITNIGILIYYKYFDFILNAMNDIFNTSFNALNILLPLGISFFTFQQLAYIIDSYKNNNEMQYKFIDYIVFVTYFPKIIQGPIALHNEIIPQLQDEKNYKLSFENMSKGIVAFAFGLAKKVLIADLFGKVANIGFGDVNGLNTITALITMFSYTVQIYFDFSGYCDMANGISLMFNIRLPMNFNSPYKATTISDFWKRWHMTLTRFFTQYIYIPLGGSRKGKVRTYINVLIIFLISGLWHGANYTFIVWGIMHGIAMVINRIFKEKINNGNPILNWLVTFMFINLTWVMFRADSISEAIVFYKNLLSFDFGNTAMLTSIINAFQTIEITTLLNIIPIFKSIDNSYHIVIQLFLAFVLFVMLGMKNTNERIEEFKPNKRTATVVVILVIVSIMSMSQVTTFLYVNF